MRAVFQHPYPDVRDTDMPHGFPACLASLLEIPLSEVPDLRCTEKNDYWHRANMWLALRKMQILAHSDALDRVLGWHIRLALVNNGPVVAHDNYALIFYGKKFVHDPNFQPMEARPFYQHTSARWLLIPLDPRR